MRTKTLRRGGLGVSKDQQGGRWAGLEWAERRQVKGARKALPLRPQSEGSPLEIWSRRVKPPDFVF